jgi:hypothetical protein
MKIEYQFFVELLKQSVPVLKQLVPVGLLIVAILKYRQDGKARKEQQEQLRRSQKASLVAKLERQHNKCDLIIENRGQSEARDIQVWVNNQLSSAHPLLQSKRIPTEMHSGFPHRITMYPNTQTPPPESIRITWTDVSGGEGVFEGKLG